MNVNGMVLTEKAVEKIHYLQENKNEYLKCQIKTLHETVKFVAENYPPSEPVPALHLIADLYDIEDNLSVLFSDQEGGAS